MKRIVAQSFCGPDDGNYNLIVAGLSKDLVYNSASKVGSRTEDKDEVSLSFDDKSQRG